MRDNFETAFLEERMKGLQALVDSILVQPNLAELPTVRKFFCLDEPPVYSDIADESKVQNCEKCRQCVQVFGLTDHDISLYLMQSWYGSMYEDSAIMLKHKLNEKDQEIELLRAELALVTIQKDNLVKLTKYVIYCIYKKR